MRHHLTSIKKTQDNVLVRIYRKQKPRALLLGMHPGVATPENSMAKSRKVKTELPCDPAILLRVLYAKEVKTLSQRDICTPVFVVALFTTAKMQRKPKCPSADGWIKKTWCVDTNVSFILQSPEFSTMWDPRLMFSV